MAISLGGVGQASQGAVKRQSQNIDNMAAGEEKRLTVRNETKQNQRHFQRHDQASIAIAESGVGDNIRLRT